MLLFFSPSYTPRAVLQAAHISTFSVCFCGILFMGFNEGLAKQHDEFSTVILYAN
jgi:hypothetical protein